MKYLYLTPFLFLAACSSSDLLNTANDLEVNLNGTDAAYCILSTPNNRYALVAPGTTLVERDGDDLEIDCKDNMSDRRRTLVVESTFSLGYWTYPSSVTVDFASSGVANMGYRVESVESATREILTEDSYSSPVDETPKISTQTYEVPVDLTNNYDAILIPQPTVEKPITWVQSQAQIQPKVNAPRGRKSYPILLD
jgi:hypothetical protein